MEEIIKSHILANILILFSYFFIFILITVGTKAIIASLMNALQLIIVPGFLTTETETRKLFFVTRCKHFNKKTSLHV